MGFGCGSAWATRFTCRTGCHRSVAGLSNGGSGFHTVLTACRLPTNQSDLYRTRGGTLAVASTCLQGSVARDCHEVCCTVGRSSRQRGGRVGTGCDRSEEHTSELQSLRHLVC